MDSLFKFCSGYCVVKVYLIHMWVWDSGIINLTVDRIYEVIPNFFIAVSLIFIGVCKLKCSAWKSKSRKSDKVTHISLCSV